MKIALVEPYLEDQSLRSYAEKPEPSHLVGMYNALVACGVESEIVDAYRSRLTADELVCALLEGGFTHVGLSSYDYEPCLSYLRKVVGALRGDAVTLVGGFGATYSPERVAKFVSPDWIIRNEGEQALPYLAQHAFSRAVASSRVSGTLVYDAAPVPLDEIAYERPYALELYNMEASPRLQKGCIGKCNFCIGAYQKRFSYVSGRRTREMLAYLRWSKNAEIISPCGPDFSTSPRKSSEVIRILLAECLPLKAFRPGIRLDTLYQAVRRAPDVWQELGDKTDVCFEGSIESFSPTRLHRLGKNVSRDWPKRVFSQIEHILDNCRSKIVLGRIALDPMITLDEFIEDSLQFIELLDCFSDRVTIGGDLMNEFVPLWGTPAMASGNVNNPWAHPEVILDKNVTTLRSELLHHPKFRQWCQLAGRIGNFDERNLVFREILRVSAERANAIVTRKSVVFATRG